MSIEVLREGPRVRQAKDLATHPVGRHVVVIGGGMTAVAVQAKLLGAEDAWRSSNGEDATG